MVAESVLNKTKGMITTLVATSREYDRFFCLFEAEIQNDYRACFFDFVY